MPRQPLLGDDQVAEPLGSTGGIRSHTAWLLKCSPSTIKRYIDRSETLAGIESKVVEQTIDLAESGLLDALNDRNLTAIMFAVAESTPTPVSDLRPEAAALGMEAEQYHPRARSVCCRREPRRDCKVPRSVNVIPSSVTCLSTSAENASGLARRPAPGFFSAVVVNEAISDCSGGTAKQMQWALSRLGMGYSRKSRDALTKADAMARKTGSLLPSFHSLAATASGRRL